MFKRKSLLNKTLISLLQAVSVLLVVFALWFALARAIDNQFVLPEPQEVAKQIVVYLGQSATYLALAKMLFRAVIAFVGSLVVALALCLLVNVAPTLRSVTDGFVTFFRALPTISIILIVMIVLKSATVPILVAFLVTFPVVYSAFCREVDASEGLLKMCKVYKMSARNKTKYVLLPLVNRALLPQCNDTLPLCIKVVVAGEVLALPRDSMGKLMSIAKINLEMANVIALTVITLVVCFAISGVFTLVIKGQKARS